ncbi:methyltransferase [Candidatus Woesearchaeota archaeon]|nr:methyltransferase [Candidatus Woesearchaeota archaeon]
MCSSKKQLAVVLSKLKCFNLPSVKSEQYSTDPEIAAEVIWSAYLQGEIENKLIADLGCGTGILGIGCLLLNAKKVFFVDKEENAINILKENLVNSGIENRFRILNKDISEFNKKVYLVIQNPPFGVKQKHADRVFLEKAFSVADVIYSFHKIESKRFIEAISKDSGFRIMNFFEFDFPLKQTMKFHKKKIQRIKVGCWKFVKSLEL